MTAERSLRLLSWESLRKNSLRGFATVELPIGLRILDCPVLVSNGRAWVALPSKPALHREGRHAKPGGVPQYTPIAEWRDKALSGLFSDRVVELLREQYPEDLEGAP
jgi:hypothetical protein